MRLEEIVKLYGFNDYLDHNTGYIYQLSIIIEEEYLAGTKASYDIPVIENDGSAYNTIGYAQLDNPNCAVELNPGRGYKADVNVTVKLCEDGSLDIYRMRSIEFYHSGFDRKYINQMDGTFKIDNPNGDDFDDIPNNTLRSWTNDALGTIGAKVTIEYIY